MRIRELLLAEADVTIDSGSQGMIGSGQVNPIPNSPMLSERPIEPQTQPAEVQPPEDQEMRQLPANNPVISDHPAWRPENPPNPQVGVPYKPWNPQWDTTPNPIQNIPTGTNRMNPYKMNPNPNAVNKPKFS